MENTSQPTPTEQPAVPVQPELTISDLQNIRSLIDTAVRRGSFQAQELSAVGAVYDKLNNFLTAIAAAAPKVENQ